MKLQKNSLFKSVVLLVLFTLIAKNAEGTIFTPHKVNLSKIHGTILESISLDPKSKSTIVQDTLQNNQEIGLKSNQPPKQPKSKDSRIEKRGLLSAVFGILNLGLASWGILPFLSIISIVLGLSSLKRFKKYPGLYKWKAFAIVGLILGFYILAVFTLLALLF